MAYYEFWFILASLNAAIKDVYVDAYPALIYLDAVLCTKVPCTDFAVLNVHIESNYGDSSIPFGYLMVADTLDFVLLWLPWSLPRKESSKIRCSFQIRV